MKFTVVAVALVALFISPALAVRDLLQVIPTAAAATGASATSFGIKFDECPAPVFKACCGDNFNYGVVTTDLFGKKMFEKTKCNVTTSRTVPVEIRPISSPLKKSEIKEYVATEPEVKRVNATATTTWDLFKFDEKNPKNPVWKREDSEIFCLCPTEAPKPLESAPPTDSANVTAIAAAAFVAASTPDVTALPRTLGVADIAP